jgi:hypothetical protein
LRLNQLAHPSNDYKVVKNFNSVKLVLTIDLLINDVKSLVDFFKTREYNNWTTHAFWKEVTKLLFKTKSSLNLATLVW